MGIEAYLTDEDGIGGDLRVNVDDFKVNEISDIKAGKTGDHLIVRVKKENWETHHLIRDLSRQLGISEGRIGIAGTKDKRAVTTQLMSISGISEEELNNVNLPRLELTPVGRSGKNIGLGDLFGNEFDITIRNIGLTGTEINERLASITSKINAGGGVPNYFGYQRFGIKRPVTHLVGKMLVKGDIEGAAMTYIARSFPWENEENRQIRDVVMDTRDFKEGVKLYPLNLRYERTMMHHLIEHPGDYIGAFRSLSPKLLKLFVHAYQSYLFNKVLSRRIIKGISIVVPVVGDVVCFVNDRMEPDTSRTDVVTRKNMPDIMYLLKRKRAFITLPLIGRDTKFDEGEIGEIEKNVLDEEGITTDDFVAGQIPELTSAGLRREVLLKVTPSFTAQDGLADIRFFLPKGCYATTVLREYMKSDPERMD
nr:tRNA pseudouridine(13) synthase TruD [Methanocella sp. CWC-04]